MRGFEKVADKISDAMAVGARVSSTRAAADDTVEPPLPAVVIADWAKEWQHEDRKRNFPREDKSLPTADFKKWMEEMSLKGVTSKPHSQGLR